MLITFFGGLAHNYYFVYAFLISAFTCGYLLIKGWRRFLIIYAGGILAAVAFVCLYFPATITHIFISPQGNHSINSLVSGNIRSERLAQLLSAVNNEILGIPNPVSEVIALVEASLIDTLVKAIYVFVLVFVIGCLVFLYKRKQEDIQKVWSELILKIRSTCKLINENTFSINITVNRHALERNMTMLFIMACTFIYVGLMSVIALDMVEFTDRYIFCVYPFISLMICACINKILINTRIRTNLIKLLLPAIMILFCILSQVFSFQQYLYKDTENRTLFNEIVKDADCIYVTPIDYYIYSMCDAFMYSDRIFPSRPADVAKIVHAVTEMAPHKRNLLIVYNSSGPFEYAQYENGLIDAKIIIDNIDEDTDYQVVFLFKAMHSVDFYNVYELKPE